MKIIMAELVFDCVDVQAERYAAFPTLLFKLHVSEVQGDPVHALLLRCQMRIEPQRRRYSASEEERLFDLFGDRARWGETLKPLQFTNVSVIVPGFRGSTDVDLPVPCSYDLEVAASKYFHSLEDGAIPLLLLFSGTVFSKGDTGYAVQQIPWHKEASYGLPVAVWREMMDFYFPNSVWLRISRDTLDALQRFKSRRALPMWDEAFETLLAEAGEPR
jgi:hypothetical protein